MRSDPLVVRPLGQKGQHLELTIAQPGQAAEGLVVLVDLLLQASDERAEQA